MVSDGFLVRLIRSANRCSGNLTYSDIAGRLFQRNRPTAAAQTNRGFAHLLTLLGGGFPTRISGGVRMRITAGFRENTH